METLKAIEKRRSVRKFIDRSISNTDIEKIVNAGRLAATANNLQPWDFIVITNKENLRRIAELAKNNAPSAEFASAVICVFCKDGKHSIEDGAAASQNILIAATDLGIASLWAAGYGKDYAKPIAELLGVPNTHILISLIVLGYSNAQPLVQKRDLKDVLHWEYF